ncbi:Protein F47B7.1 [Aphelenchoides avenae]|nr:Protein F47B7.1 [Aphelenchus avenae]KAH7708305.1 Protein F47B7.1 [Aphelenchus avenae]
MRLLLLSSIFVGALVCGSFAEKFAEPGSVPAAGVSLDGEKQSPLERLLTRSKRSGGRWTTQQIIECIFCIFLPPVAVLIHGGHDQVLHLVINIILWILGWVPGTIHAFWYCFFR